MLEFQSTERMQDLASMVDVTEHLNNLNKMLQGRNKVVTQYYDSICAFKVNLSLWEMQPAGGDAASSLTLSGRCVCEPTCHSHEVVQR